MGRRVFGQRVWYRVGSLTVRTEAEDRMESGIMACFWLKLAEYFAIASGEALTARTLWRRLVRERWAKSEEIRQRVCPVIG